MKQLNCQTGVVLNHFLRNLILITELLELDIKQREIDSKGRDMQLETMKSLMSQFNNNHQSPANEVETKNNPKLSKLISLWLEIKKTKLARSSYETLEPRIRLFERVLYENLAVKELLVAEITSDMIREYKELLEKLPAKRSGKEFKGKTINELVSMNVEKISSKTYLYNLDLTKQFLNWARLEGYQVNERLEGVLQVARKNTTATPKRQRVPFSDSDLKKIFENERYSDCKLERASEYWAPLISLYTGTRLGEVCQLSVGDIKKIENVWCFNITETGDDDKRLKAKGSERIVPIHNQLIKLGLIEYRDVRSKIDAKLLDEVRDDSGRFSAFQKRMNYYFKNLGLGIEDGETKGFHSFRHLVRTKLVELNINEGLIDAIVGHTSSDRSIGSKFYTHTQLITQKNEALQKLGYGIDFTKIKKWKDFRFARLM